MPAPTDTAAWAAFLHDRLGLTLPVDRQVEFASWAADRPEAGDGQRRWRDRLAALPLEDEAWQAVIQAATIGETYFWRHERHMTVLETIVLPDLLRQDRPLVIWSAGCSTGEEIYSVAMLIDRVCPEAGERIRLVGSDINLAAVGRAQSGRYTRNSLRTLAPDAWQRQYFEQQSDGSHLLKPDLRRRVSFGLVELTAGDPTLSLPELEMVDLILCRNVAIYFDAARRRQMLDMFARRLHRHGWLLMGDAEVDDTVRTHFHLHDRQIPSLFRARRPQPAAQPVRERHLPVRPVRAHPAPVPVAPAPPNRRETATAMLAGIIRAEGLPAAQARLLYLAADRPGDPAIQLATAYLALADGDPARAVPALQRAMLVSGQPLIGGLLRRVRQDGTDCPWAEQLLALAESVREDQGDGRNL